MKKQSIIILIQFILIILLLAYVIKSSYIQKQQVQQENGGFLLSPRVYSGILKPQSLLILNLKPLQTGIENYIDENNLNVSLYVLNVRDGASIGINSTKTFPPASLNKLPVSMVIMSQIEKGKLSLDTKLQITNEDRDSGSGTLYLTNESEMSVKPLLEYMLEDSDNTAYNVLSHQITLGELNDLSTYLNFYNKDVDTNNSLYDNSFYISPKSTANLFLSLYLSTYLQPKDSEYLLGLLANSTFDIRGYAGLPENVTVAQKYGSYYFGKENYFHDCGIIYIDESRMFYCVMTQNMEKEKSQEVISAIVNVIYRYVVETRNKNQINYN